METSRVGLTLPDIRNSWIHVSKSTLRPRIKPRICPFSRWSTQNTLLMFYFSRLQSYISENCSASISNSFLWYNSTSLSNSFMWVMLTIDDGDCWWWLSAMIISIWELFFLSTAVPVQELFFFCSSRSLFVSQERFSVFRSSDLQTTLDFRAGVGVVGLGRRESPPELWGFWGVGAPF